jgi:hypothetical protein
LALAIGVVGWRLRRRGAAWALAIGAALVMALDHPLLIYARILEPEALLVLSVCLWLALLDKREPSPPYPPLPADGERGENPIWRGSTPPAPGSFNEA